MAASFKQKTSYSFALAASWLAALLISIGFSIYFGLELIKFGRGERTAPPFTGELKIAILDWVGYYPMVVADRKGFINRRLRNTGVHVELVNAPSGTGEMNDLIRTGKVHGSFGVIADFVVLKSLATPIRLVMVSDFSKSDVVVARKDIKKPLDLRGKRIGIAELSSYAEYALVRILESAGIDRHSVSFRTVPAMQVPEAIVAGTIDAGYTWEPARQRAIANDMNVVLSSEINPELVISGLALRDEVLVNPEVAAAVILSYFDGLTYLAENPKDSGEIVAKYFGTQPDDVLRILKEDSLFIDLKRNLEIFATGGIVHKEMQAINQYFGERGIRQANESVAKLVDLAPLREVERIQRTEVQ
ncbi:MAG: ABC transporter substrate-binding protein [Deltaproteobacteria bacterium]|nr:ABC transporter substrate-binding protein [Deltaproteobacteria bacterium]